MAWFCHLIPCLSTLKNVHYFNWLKKVTQIKIKLLFLEKVALIKSYPEKKNRKLNEDVLQVMHNFSQLFKSPKFFSFEVVTDYCKKNGLKLIENPLQREMWVKAFKNEPSKFLLGPFLDTLTHLKPCQSSTMVSFPDTNHFPCRTISLVIFLSSFLVD